MDLAERAALVRSYRCEIKASRAGLRPRNPDDLAEQERNASVNLRHADRRRPKLPHNPTEADLGAHRSAVSRYESDAGSRGGFALGEQLRSQYENRVHQPRPTPDRPRTMGGRAAEPFGLPSTSNVHGQLTRRMNVTMRRRTGFSGPNGVEQSITPSERADIVGVRSRRRHVSPGLVPNGPPRRR